MHDVTNKIKSKRGSSLILALLFLLLAAVLGGIVLTAASVSASSGAKIRKAQQSYLAVLSAQKLMVKELSSFTFSAAWETREFPVSMPNPKKEGETIVRMEATHSVKEFASLDEGTTGLLIAILDADLKDRYKRTLPDTEFASLKEGLGELALSSHELKFSPLEIDGNEAIPAVWGTLTLDADYTVTVSLWTKEDGVPTNEMTFSVPATVIAHEGERSKEGNSDSILYRTTVEWKKPPVIKKGGASLNG